jgi:hypothetical protein
MNQHENPSTGTSTSPRTRVGVAIATLALAGGVAGLAGTPAPAQAGTTASACVPVSRTTDWKSAATAADTALGKALVYVRKGRYVRATKQLRVVKRKTRNANTAATALIGKPPTDPESDDPPGVTAVLKVSGFDHRITLALVPLFSDRSGQHVVASLSRALYKAAACRDVMLGTVIAQRPAVRDDYVDGLSDTLPVYPKELAALAAALAGRDLTPAGRSTLERTRRVVSATSAAMGSVFGGGERSTR